MGTRFVDSDMEVRMAMYHALIMDSLAAFVGAATSSISVDEEAVDSYRVDNAGTPYRVDDAGQVSLLSVDAPE